MSAPPAGEAPALIAMAEALRGLIDRFVATSAPPELFAGLAAELRSVTGRLADYQQDRLYRFGEASVAMVAVAGRGDGPDTDPAVMIAQRRAAAVDHSPVQGAANPLAPPLRLTFEPRRVIGRVRFGRAYEGPPGCVHGGFVAVAFDEVLGAAQWLTPDPVPAMTGRLTVHYRSPTPLETELRLEAELARVDGRKRVVTGRLFHGDVLCADAEALFVAVPVERFAGLLAADAARKADDGRRAP